MDFGFSKLYWKRHQTAKCITKLTLFHQNNYNNEFPLFPVTFTSAPDSSIAVAENSYVELTCTVTSNPLLNLWLHDLTTNTDLFSGTTVLESYTASVLLTRNDNGRIFGCRATGDNPNYYIQAADTYSFSVECRYLHVQKSVLSAYCQLLKRGFVNTTSL